ncbi:hypothetical protein BTJ68_15257 [Hortaea werneckii EXF-2000]|uniref:Uncharacterized protein n=1 Tax=Hortaea werneckii EXF-2000 TaxID=1157616 RepID=A0A1Z5SMF6_HORWE|nr:hypothetical protein BTJ68_15257 [Hortaea werneckii EXF-2000]
MLVIATYVVYYYIHNPGLASFAQLHAVIVWLKVCSYAFTNRDMRHAYVNTAGVSSATNSLESSDVLPSLYKKLLLSKQHQSCQSKLLLVGTHSGLPARLPFYRTHSMGLRRASRR